MPICLPSFAGVAQPASGGTPFENLKSVSFDGSDDRIVLASGLESTINSASTLTISAWFKLTAYDSSIFSSGTSGTNGIWLYPYNSSLMLLTVRNGSNTGISCTSPSLNAWHHVAGVLDGSNSKIYIDGNLEITGTLPALGSTGGSSPSIGSFLNTGGFANGLIDEVSIFDSALSASDVSDIYNSGVPNDLGPDGLNLSPVGWWRMGDGTEAGSGTTVYDMSGNSNNGTLTNGPTYSTSVPS